MNQKDIDISSLKHQDVLKQSEKGKIPDSFLEEQMPMVMSIASSVMAKGSLPTGIDKDDLVSWGTEGLIKAYRNFKAEKGSKLATYAFYRVRGEIFDRIRQEWHYRNPHKYQDYRKKIQERLAEIVEDAIRTGKEVDRVSLEESVNQMIANSSMSCLLSLDALEEVNIAMPEAPSDHGSAVWECVQELTQEEQDVIQCFYREDLKQKEIAEKLKISKSKVCRIHMKALEKLKRKLEQKVEAI